MDVVTLRAAAGGGAVNGTPAAALAAAGFTMLQRGVPLVRALAGRRAAILLPASPAWVVALAAADGRAALLLSVDATSADIAQQCRSERVGAVFTIRALSTRIPDEIPRVLLDDAPARATFTVPGGDDVSIDLGSHFGLALEGDADAPGRDEECVIIAGSVLTHRMLLHDARHAIAQHKLSAESHIVAARDLADRAALVTTLIAPLMAGAAITTARA